MLCICHLYIHFRKSEHIRHFPNPNYSPDCLKCLEKIIEFNWFMSTVFIDCYSQKQIFGARHWPCVQPTQDGSHLKWFDDFRIKKIVGKCENIDFLTHLISEALLGSLRNRYTYLVQSSCQICSFVHKLADIQCLAAQPNHHSIVELFPRNLQFVVRCVFSARSVHLNTF